MNYSIYSGEVFPGAFTCHTEPDRQAPDGRCLILVAPYLKPPLVRLCSTLNQTTMSSSTVTPPVVHSHPSQQRNSELAQLFKDYLSPIVKRLETLVERQKESEEREKEREERQKEREERQKEREERQKERNERLEQKITELAEHRSTITKQLDAIGDQLNIMQRTMALVSESTGDVLMKKHC
jgi:predicted ribosome quality control (RQC) complex YloA/Tae2 family protein